MTLLDRNNVPITRLTHAERRTRRERWIEAVRAGKNPAEIALADGVCEETVKLACRTAEVKAMADGHSPAVSRAGVIATRRRAIADAARAGASMAELMASFGVGSPTIRDACLVLGVDPPKRPRMTVPSKIPWMLVDWRLTNTFIARQYGVSRERVRQVREKLNKPKSDLAGLSDCSIRALAALNGGEKKSTKLVAKIAGISPTAISSLRKRLGIACAADAHCIKFPWPSVDWRLSNADLSRIWDVSYVNVAARRCQKKMQSAKKGWGGTNQKRFEDPELIDALLAEEARAKSWKDNHPISFSRAPTPPPLPLPANLSPTAGPADRGEG